MSGAAASATALAGGNAADGKGKGTGPAVAAGTLRGAGNGGHDDMALRIGERLLEEKRITPEQLQEALSHQRQSGGKLGAHLVKLGFVTDEEITSLLSKQYGVPSIALNQFEIDPGVIKLVPAETAHKYQIIPLSRVGATLTIAMTDPTNVFALDDLKFMTGYSVEPVLAWETAVLDAILKYYGAPGTGPKSGGNTQRIIEPSAGESALEIAARAMREMPLVDAGDVEVTGGARGNQRRGADPAGRRRAGCPSGQCAADGGGLRRAPATFTSSPTRRSCGSATGLMASFRPSCTPPLWISRGDRVAAEDHGAPRHRREAAAAGRTD